MARRRHTPEQVVRKLREADRLLGEGQDLAAVAKHLQISEGTYHRWRNPLPPDPGFEAFRTAHQRKVLELGHEQLMSHRRARRQRGSLTGEVGPSVLDKPAFRVVVGQHLPDLIDQLRQVNRNGLFQRGVRGDRGVYPQGVGAGPTVVLRTGLFRPL
jgi:hypothetical protein